MQLVLLLFLLCSSAVLGYKNCSDFRGCNSCLTRSDCVWVIYQYQDNACERYTNQTRYYNNTCDPCQHNITRVAGLSMFYCNAGDGVMGVATLLAFFFSAFVYICVSKIKLNHWLYASQAAADGDHWGNRLTWDWVILLVLCAFTFFLVLVSPVMSFFMFWINLVYAAATYGYCVILYGHQKSMELLNYNHLLKPRNVLASAIEGREANEMLIGIDNWNRSELCAFVASAAEDEVLEYLEYTPFFKKLASQVIAILSMGLGMMVFILFGVIIPAVGSDTGNSGGTMSAAAFGWLMILALGLTSDVVLVITNKRFFFSDHKIFLPNFSKTQTGKAELSNEVTPIITDKLFPILPGKSFIDGGVESCAFYFYDTERMTEYLQSKNIVPEVRKLNQRIFAVGLLLVLVLTLAVVIGGSYESTPNGFFISMGVLAFLVALVMYGFYVQLSLKVTHTIYKRQVDRDEVRPLVVESNDSKENRDNISDDNL